MPGAELTLPVLTWWNSRPATNWRQLSCKYIFLTRFRITYYSASAFSQIFLNIGIWSYSGPQFSAFGLNTERYAVSPHSIRMWGNADQTNSEYGHFMRSGCCYEQPKLFSVVKYNQDWKQTRSRRETSQEHVNDHPVNSILSNYLIGVELPSYMKLSKRYIPKFHPAVSSKRTVSNSHKIF